MTAHVNMAFSCPQNYDSLHRQGNEAIKELTLAFIDDMAFIAIGKDFKTTHEILTTC